MQKKLSKRFPNISKRAVKGDTVGVFIIAPKDISKQFKSLGDHDNSKPHITALYIGQVPKKQRDLLANLVKIVISNTEPFEVSLDSKVTYFPATKHSDDCKVAKMGIISPELKKLHKVLKEMLKDAEIEIADNFPDYKPHITLEYMEPGKEKFDGDMPSGKSILFSYGDAEITKL